MACSVVGRGHQCGVVGSRAYEARALALGSEGALLKRRFTLRRTAVRNAERSPTQMKNQRSAMGDGDVLQPQMPPPGLLMAAATLLEARRSASLSPPFGLRP
jgi:hypothetical protein